MATNQTTNNNSIRSILKKEKLNGSNFLDWYRNLRIVLRNEQKLHHLEEALLEAPPTTATAAVRNAYTRRQADQELFKNVKAFHSCKQEEGQSVSTYVLKMKAYLDQMEHLGYPMPLVLRVNMILTSLSNDYDQFVQNYNMHGMGKTIPELHAMLKLVEKGIPKKTPPSYKGLRGYRKLNKGALDLYVGNDNTTTVKAIGSFDLILHSGMILVLDNCHFSPTITRGVISLLRLWDNGFRHKFMDNGAISVSKDNICYFNAFPCDGIFKIDMHNHISNEHSIYTCSNKKTKHKLDSTFLWHCRLGHINKKRIEKPQHDGLLNSIDEESFDVCVSCISGKMSRKPFTYASEIADDLLGIIHSDVCGPFRTTSREGANYYVTFTDDFSRYGYVYLIKHKHEVFETFKTFQNEVENQLGKTIKALRLDRGGEIPKGNNGLLLSYPLESKIFVARYVDFFETNLIKQEVSGSTIDFDEIQSEDPQPSENTSLHQHEVEHDTVEPQTDVILVCRSIRIPQAPEQYGFYIDGEVHELGDHRKPPNYQAALSDPESKKWLEAMNMKMQSMKDNQVWNLVDLPPNCKTVGSKWLFKKKTNMDGNTHTYKARLVAKGFTQTYEVDYEETFSPIASIKAIRILIAIAAYYDYEIWQMDVKTAFLNSRLNEDVYMVQHEGFVNPKHPR
ncbi:retrotransposon protein, putative, ty1-copia subclass [Tanacetum coccineum]